MKTICRTHKRSNCSICKGKSLFASDDPGVWMEAPDSAISYSSDGNYTSGSDYGSSSSYDSGSSYSSGG